MAESFWTSQVPVYVTNKTAGGQVGAFYVTGWVFMLAALLVTINVLGWGIVGVVELLDLVF